MYGMKRMDRRFGPDTSTLYAAGTPQKRAAVLWGEEGQTGKARRPAIAERPQSVVLSRRRDQEVAFSSPVTSTKKSPKIKNPAGCGRNLQKYFEADL